MQIVFRCDGAKLPEVGTGHVVRMLAIASGLVANNACQKKQIIFVTRDDGKYLIGANAVRDAGFELHMHIPGKDLEWNSQSEAQLLINLQPNILIIDRLNSDLAWMEMVKQSGIKVIAFDDVGPGAKLADIIINGIFHTLEPLSNVYQGYQYLSLRTKPFLGKFKLRDKVTKIMATFGGHDERNLTGFFLDALIESSSTIEDKEFIYIEIFTRGESLTRIREWQEKIKILNTSGWRRIVISESSPDFYKNIAMSDILVCSGGITVFEGISLGVPTIGLPQYEHQMETLLTLASKGILVLGAASMNLNSQYFKTQFISMMESKYRRGRLSSRGTSIVDGLGYGRVLKILEEAIFQEKIK